MEMMIINLIDRKDRREEAIAEIKNSGLECFKYSFFDAKRDVNFPLRGCASSHAMALSTFLFHSESDHVLIFEDDFQINNHLTFLEDLNEVMAIAEGWDVALLAHNQAVPIAPTRSKKAQRVVNSQTASAYVVKRSFTPKLIELFFSSANKLGEIRTLIEPNKSFARHQFAHDIWWKSLQNEFTFVATFPALVIQRKSYSDIEGKVVDYGV